VAAQLLPFDHTMSLIDKHGFEMRSHAGCSNSDYQLCRTECCGRFGVEDDELLDFYFDPVDLSRHIFLERGAACPFCASKNFSFEEIEEITEMPAEWRWAVPRDLQDTQDHVI
jgi:hypothetical protein